MANKVTNLSDRLRQAAVRHCGGERTGLLKEAAVALDQTMASGGEVVERSAALADALGELIDALSDEVRYECGQSSHVVDKIEQGCALLGPEYHGYIGKWND